MRGQGHQPTSEDTTLFGDDSLRSSLASGQVHVWLTHEGHIGSPALLRAFRQMLSGDEKAKCDRLVFARDRHQALIARALVRTTLSRYASVAPAAWRFRLNPFGRPEINGPGEHTDLRFNLSHTRGLVACVVSLKRQVGVDVENRLRSGRLVDVAQRFFSPLEATALNRLAPERQLDRFFTYWTLKESYIKARGMGLAIPLADFSFLLDKPNDGIRISFSSRIQDDPALWSFTFHHLSIRHSLATTVERRADEPPPRVIIQTVIPLGNGV